MDGEGHCSPSTKVQNPAKQSLDCSYIRHLCWLGNELLHDMSKILSQSDLQKMQILSKFILPKIYNIVIWKLHEDIPCPAMQPTHPLLRITQKEQDEPQ